MSEKNIEIVDTGMIRLLNSSYGEAFQKELILNFIKSSQREIDAIEQNLCDSGQSELLKNALIKLRVASANRGAVALADFCENIEAQIDNLGEMELNVLLERLKVIHAKSIEALNKFVVETSL